jgi:hypothetical protein
MFKKCVSLLPVVLLAGSVLAIENPKLKTGNFIQAGIFSAGPNSSLLRTQHLKSSSGSYEKLDWPGMGFSAGVITELHCFTPFTSIGLEFRYLNTKASFHSDDFTGSIPELTHYLKNNISEHQLELPVYFKLHTDNPEKAFYLFGGAALKYIFLNKREVEHIRFNMNTPQDKTITAVSKGRFDFKNEHKTGGLFMVGIGKSFPLRGTTASVELRYMKDMNVWNYPITYNGIEQVIPVELKTLSIQFRCAL